MSKMGEYVLFMEEIVDPMVYIGHTDEDIIKEVLSLSPNTPMSWIQDLINRARFDHCSMHTYA